MNKAYYFNVMGKEVKVQMPYSPMAKFLVYLFSAICLFDLWTGNLLGAFLMFIFAAIHVIDIR